jgi:hypothetical protein
MLKGFQKNTGFCNWCVSDILNRDRTKLDIPINSYAFGDTDLDEDYNTDLLEDVPEDY